MPLVLCDSSFQSMEKLLSSIPQSQLVFNSPIEVPKCTAALKMTAIEAPVFSAPVTTVEHVAPAAPVVTRTISPIHVPFRHHAPVAQVFDSRFHA